MTLDAPAPTIRSHSLADLKRAAAAEAVGAAFLVAAVVGSGIMAERLAGGNMALALLANTIATGAALFALIVSLAGISGAHFNPVVTLVMAWRRELAWRAAGPYIAAQIAGALIGVVAAHAMFAEPLIALSTHVRAGPAQMFSELVETFGLVGVIVLSARRGVVAVAAAVAGYIMAAYWFTASTSFANPAVTIGRALTDSFAGIRPADVPGFILAQLCGAALAAGFFGWLGRCRST